jgi:hypothetical protein
MSLLDTASLIVTPNGYKEGTLYSVIPSDGSGDMSVVRATTATRVNSAGLVELVPYNLLSWSEQYSNAYWTKGNVTVTSNSTISPNGTLTADTLTDTSSGGYTLGASANVSAEGAIITFSQYAKYLNNDLIYLGVARAGATPYGEVVCFYNINTGVTGINTTYGTANFISSNIENVGNGWYRCSMTISVPLATAYVVYTANGKTNGVPFVSDIGDASYQWGSQINEGTIKPYQKTETRLNIPRLDYSNGTCPSLLVEPQRTNRVLYSEQLNNTAWFGTSFITPNTTISPSGILNADTLATSQSNNFWQGISATTSTTYTISLWVKLGTATNLCLVVNNQLSWNSIGGQSFNSANGLNTSTWTRISYTFTTPAVLPLGGINYHIGGNAETGLTQSTGTVFIWGAQLEAGTYPTSYIPTTSASVTRNADVVSKTGISSLIGQTEGTMFIDTYIDNIASQTNDPVLFYLKGVGTEEAYVEFLPTGRVYAVFATTSAVTCFINVNIGLQNGRHKFAFGYKNNDFTLFLDGVEIGTDTSGTSSASFSQFGLQYHDNFYRGTQSINASALWKTRLTNTQLAQLTTI